MLFVGAAAMPQGMSEDEALAAALAASMADVPAPPTSQSALSQVLFRKVLYTTVPVYCTMH